MSSPREAYIGNALSSEAQQADLYREGKIFTCLDITLVVEGSIGETEERALVGIAIAVARRSAPAKKFKTVLACSFLDEEKFGS